MAQAVVLSSLPPARSLLGGHRRLPGRPLRSAGLSSCPSPPAASPGPGLLRSPRGWPGPPAGPPRVQSRRPGTRMGPVSLPLRVYLLRLPRGQRPPRWLRCDPASALRAGAGPLGRLLRPCLLGSQAPSPSRTSSFWAPEGTTSLSAATSPRGRRLSPNLPCVNVGQTCSDPPPSPSFQKFPPLASARKVVEFPLPELGPLPREPRAGGARDKAHRVLGGVGVPGSRVPWLGAQGSGGAVGCGSEVPWFWGAVLKGVRS